MELDLQSLYGLQVHSCTHWLRTRNSPLPSHLGLNTRALLVSQDRRHLFVSCDPLGRHEQLGGQLQARQLVICKSANNKKAN